MKRKANVRADGQFNKKKMIALAMLILWRLLTAPVQGEQDALLWMTGELLPVFAYERLYGDSSAELAASYGVPDWFPGEKKMETAKVIEKEDAKEQNTEQVTTETLTEAPEPAKASGKVFTKKQLKNRQYLLDHIFTVDPNTSMTPEELDYHTLMESDLSIDGWGDQQGDYRILIYHTHGSESFVDSREGMKEDTVIGAGAYLAEILEKQYGIRVYHDETLYDIVDGQLDRSRAYEQAYAGVTKILKEHPSIEVVIDLHRDGIDENTRLVTEVNGKPTAKIMFLNGVSRSNTNGDIDYLYNPNKLMNLAFSFQMYLAGREAYGDYVRKIYVRSYRYNLHLLPRTTLIEAGAQTNTVEEEKNAMEPLAAILHKVLSKPE